MLLIKDILHNHLANNLKMENIIKTNENIDEQLHKNAIKNIANQLISNYQFNENNIPIFQKLFYYFTGNEEKCNEFGLSLNKGIYLFGSVGSGKTVVMKIFQAYCKLVRLNGFQLHEAIDIINNTNISGVEYLEKYSIQNNSAITMLLDDICSSNEKVKNYGTDINVIENLISQRYIVYCKLRKLTHFTSNIYPVELINKYDERIVSRLCEMTNPIELKGNDYRLTF